jgi:hypothetical protein
MARDVCYRLLLGSVFDAGLLPECADIVEKLK